MSARVVTTLCVILLSSCGTAAAMREPRVAMRIERRPDGFRAKPTPPTPPAPTPPPAASKEGTKSSKQLTGVGFDVVAGVIATTLLLSTTSNKEYSADVSTKKAPTKPTGSGASDAKANAASAQVSLFLFSYGQLV